MKDAPFFTDVADGPDDGHAYWLTTEDQVRIRIGIWNKGGAKGTVLLFPGRTEHIEKYGRTAGEFAARGLATLAVDWRGQGIADRLLDDPATGHVHWFSDYQKDVSAVLDAAKSLNMPEPYYLLAHSMGGCIGLRALHNGLPVRAAVFSGPMWGINMAPSTRPAAWALAWGGTLAGLGNRYAPGSSAESYLATSPFDDNLLTTDPESWDYMKAQITTHPDLLLGGPSLRWVREALVECRNLDKMDSPPLPAITFLGTNERIVDANRIHSRMERWTNGKLEMIDPGEHEVLMEGAAMRTIIHDKIEAFFASIDAEQTAEITA